MAPTSALPPHLSIEGERVQLAAPNPKARHDARSSEGHGASSAVVADDPSLLSRKKRGPPATGKGTLIGVRLQPPDLSALDEWVAAQKDKPSRPEAIRRLLGQVLRKKR